MLRGVLLLALAVTTAACGTRQARTGETGRKGRIIAVTDTILDTGGTDTVRFGRMHSGEVAVLRLWIENRASKPVAITRYDRSAVSYPLPPFRKRYPTICKIRGGCHDLSL